MTQPSNKPYANLNSSSETEARTRLCLSPLNGILSPTPIVFDLRNWAGRYITVHADGTDAYVKFSDMEIDVVNETTTLLVAPADSLYTITGCCFKIAEGGSQDMFVHPRFPFLHAVRGYTVNGYLRLARS